MAHERCIDVSEEIWKDFEAGEPREIPGRTGALYQGEAYHLPFLDRALLLSRPGGGSNLMSGGR